MKTVIIDNDSKSLQNIENILEDINLTTIIGKYTSVKKAEAAILKICPDLLILEVNLQELDGITLAKRIEKQIHNIKIIFISSNSDNALEAFELNQVDFILKPINPSRITQAIEKLKSYTLKLPVDENHLICCFKNLHYIKYSESTYFEQITLNWRTKYAKEMFTYLIVHRKINIRKDVLIDLFWPEASVKDSYNILYTTVHYIRRAIEIAELPITIKNHENHYSLNLNGVKLDFEVWLTTIKKYKSINLLKLEKTMSMYQGHFLEEENYLWGEYKRQKYRLLWQKSMEYVIEQHVEQKNIYKAILNALNYQKIEPYLEKTYHILMELYAELRDFDSIRIQYNKLKKMLKEEYNINPQKNLTYYMKRNIEK